jgi:hypothetical protein
MDLIDAECYWPKSLQTKPPPKKPGPKSPKFPGDILISKTAAGRLQIILRERIWREADFRPGQKLAVEFTEFDTDKWCGVIAPAESKGWALAVSASKTNGVILRPWPDGVAAPPVMPVAALDVQIDNDGGPFVHFEWPTA